MKKHNFFKRTVCIAAAVDANFVINSVATRTVRVQTILQFNDGS